MNFLAPGRLWLLVVVVGLAAAYVVLQRRRRHYAARFTNLDLLASVAPKRPGWRRHVGAPDAPRACPPGAGNCDAGGRHLGLDASYGRRAVAPRSSQGGGIGVRRQ